jgi:hypothetical protein
MSRYASSCYARCEVYFLAQPQPLVTRIVVIAQHPRSGLDSYRLKALRIQQPARHLSASDSVLGLDLRVLRNIDFDARLRVRPQQQAGKNKYPKKRIFQHMAISRRINDQLAHRVEQNPGRLHEALAHGIEAWARNAISAYFLTRPITNKSITAPMMALMIAAMRFGAMAIANRQ